MATNKRKQTDASLQMFLNTVRELHLSMQMNFLSPHETRIERKLGHIWLWRYLSEKVTKVKRAFHL